VQLSDRKVGRMLVTKKAAVMCSRLEPMKKIAHIIRTHRPLILNGFQARRQVSAVAVEGLTNNVSSQSVKHYIGEMIAAETVDVTLSDDEIVEKLKERNITVARRTVVKYREALNIPSSPRRKRLKLEAI
jgi:Sigma-54, DNA binding domain